MHYSWIGFVYQATAWLGQRLAEKWFDMVLALLGTLFGYWLAKRHLEHFVSGIVEKMDAKYLDLNRQTAFRRAVAAMLPELPRFYMRPTSTFSSQVATAIGEFTSWSTVTGWSFCTRASERVYITARPCETELGGTRGL